MLIKFSHLLEKYEFTPVGILHIGAHEMEERKDYISHGIENICWVEGNAELVERGIEKIDPDHEKLLHGLIYSEDDKVFEFKITNNSQSSSILEFGTHKQNHPQVEFVNSVRMSSTTIKTLLSKNMVSVGDFDFVNLDIQGVELQALKGFGEYLDPVKYIYTEINVGQVYKGNDTIEEMDHFLGNLGFYRVETNLTEYSWGDAFYIKQNK
jgi:FkbM family methyltransferase